MSKISLHKFSAPGPQYRWRDRFGELHLPEDMETRHLFHVLRMIWDHSMPKKWQTTYLNRYRFPAYYTVEYMATSIKMIFLELINRNDLTAEMHYWIAHMWRCFADKEIEFVRKIGEIKLLEKSR